MLKLTTSGNIDVHKPGARRLPTVVLLLAITALAWHVREASTDGAPSTTG
jgi:hypothetical protein